MQVEKIEDRLDVVHGIPERGLSLAQWLNQALMAKARSGIGDSGFGVDGRLTDWSNALVRSLDAAWLDNLGAVADRGRFREPCSGQVIALNSFIGWQANPEQLMIAGSNNFRELRFGGRCPTGIRGTPPYLDLIAKSPGEVVAVCARGTEYLSRKRSKLAHAYLDVHCSREFEPWRDLAGKVANNDIAYQHIDVAALIKFAFGLNRTFPGHKIKLLYLFWEPELIGDVPSFREHRYQLAEIGKIVQQSNVTFVSQSFEELWSFWLEKYQQLWVAELVDQLRERFTVVLST